MQTKTLWRSFESRIIKDFAIMMSGWLAAQEWMCTCDLDVVGYMKCAT